MGYREELRDAIEQWISNDSEISRLEKNRERLRCDMERLVKLTCPGKQSGIFIMPNGTEVEFYTNRNTDGSDKHISFWVKHRGENTHRL